nr:MAG TPA: hypothetical protein [Caudoviricetes sp.]
MSILEMKKVNNAWWRNRSYKIKAIYIILG